VSGLRVTFQGPSFGEMMAGGPPRRYGDMTVYTYHPPFDLTGLRRADVILRIAAALLVGGHLVVLNLRGARPDDSVGGQCVGARGSVFRSRSARPWTTG